MPAIDNIIQVNVTQATTAVATTSFAIPLILGPTKATGAVPTVVTCGQPSDLLTQGYTASSTEYIYALALCSQALRPSSFKVATRTATGAIGADIAAVSSVDDTWYGIVIPQAVDADIIAAASQIESMTKLFIAASATAAIGTSATNDLASTLQSSSLTRTALLFSPGSAAAGIDAAWLGGQSPKSPGSATWAYKTLSGIPADALSPSQAAACIGIPVTGTAGKAANIYQTVGGVAVTQEGTLAGGGFIDLRIGIDSLRSLIKSNCYAAFVNNDKIPYTDVGACILESAIRSAIDTHVDYGFIARASATTPITVTHTPVAQVSITQRAQRIGPPFTFACQAAGAQHAAVIAGTVNI